MDLVAELKKELKQPPKIEVLDLSNYIALQKENPKYKIGVIGDCPQNFSGYKKGHIVLYEPYTIEEGIYRLSSKEIERSIQQCTIHKPSDRYFKGESNISTIGTCVGFPLKYIEYEIKV